MVVLKEKISFLNSSFGSSVAAVGPQWAIWGLTAKNSPKAIGLFLHTTHQFSHVKCVHWRFQNRISFFFGYGVHCESEEMLKGWKWLEHACLGHLHVWLLVIFTQVKGPFRSNVIVLKDLKPLRTYCLQVNAQLSVTEPDISRVGHWSNITCHETIVDGKLCLLVPFLSWEKNTKLVKLGTTY